MSHDDSEDTTLYKVVVNHEEQYSIWPSDREIPLGRNLSLERDMFQNWRGLDFHGFNMTGGTFIDIGTPTSYKEAQHIFARAGGPRE